MKFEKKKSLLNNLMLTKQGQVLVNNGLHSVSNNQWLKIDNQDFYFKKETKCGHQSSLGELIYYFSAKKLGMNALEVKPAHVFSYLSNQDQLNSLDGILSQSFITDKNSQKFLDFHKINMDVSVDVESNFAQLMNYINNYKKENITVNCDTKKIHWQLKQVCMLDYFFVLWDRHNGNLGIIETTENNQIKIELSPIFDNSMIFFMTFDGLFKSMKNLLAKKQYSKLKDKVDNNFSSCFYMTANPFRFAQQNLKGDIAHEILENKEAEKFYNKIKKLNLKEIALEIKSNNPNYKIPTENINLAQFILNYQVENIEKTLQYIKNNKKEFQRYVY